MTGIRCCCRSLLLFNTSRLPDRNGVLLQLTRKRHHLAFQICSLQNNKPKLVNDSNRLLVYRLASTHIIQLKEPVSISNLKISEVKSDSNQLNKEVTQLNNEPVQSSKGSEIVESSNSNVIDESLLPPIPSEGSEAPVMDFISMGLKEPTFQSLGLGSWWPPGMIQQFLEFLHINMDLPWWESILIITIILRSFLLPLHVEARKNSINLTNNHMPVIMNYNKKINDARLKGDFYNVALHNQELQKYVKENDVKFFGFMKVALVQGPVFLAVYYALNGMANTPVESLKTGGLFWFTDLTQPDPYYILPVILSASLLAVIETGAEGNPSYLSSNLLKWTLRGIPVVTLLFTLNFSASLTWYWTISNMISLSLVVLFKIPAIKNYLKMPDLDPVKINMCKEKNDKGFVEKLKEGYTNAQIADQLRNREQMNLMAIQKAGSGPIRRTFKENPLLKKAKKSS